MVQSMPGIHTMQNLNEYLRALQEHGVNQVCRDMIYRDMMYLPRVWRRHITRLQNFAKGLTDGCFMEGFMRMKRVPFIDLPAGQTVALKPGGFHVMLMGLKEPLPADSHVQLTLLFEDANGVKSQQDLHVMTTPKAPGGAAPAGGDHAHQH